MYNILDILESSSMEDIKPMRERPGLESGSILDTGHVVSRHAGWMCVNQTDPMLATLEPWPVIIIFVKKNIFLPKHAPV